MGEGGGGGRWGREVGEGSTNTQAAAVMNRIELASFSPQFNLVKGPIIGGNIARRLGSVPPRLI